MCGIAGFIGKHSAQSVILDGLEKLEYRGYDSAGIALVDDKKIFVKKTVGKIKALEEGLAGEIHSSKIGIGHTRWATHGAPSKKNAHPHLSNDGKIAVVHNGIVENYAEIRKYLREEKGIECKSDTDTEVIAQLVSLLYSNGNSLEDSVHLAVEKMRGAYAFAVVASDEPGKIVGYRKDAPLIAAHTDEGSFIASDIPALLKYSHDILLLENDEMIILKEDQVEIFDKERKPVNRDTFHVDWSIEDAEKGGFEHFMLKEIYDQPKVVKDTLARRLDENGNINLDGIKLSKDDLENIDKIYIVACGTAYHAGLVGKYLIEKMARKIVEVDVASEFRYRDPYVDDKTLFITVSQSGETLDTLMALREAKRKGARILSIVNVVGSTIARESDDVLYTWAGPEIAVASTKGYTTQLMCMYLIALYMGSLNGTIDSNYCKKIIEQLRAVPDKISKILESTGNIERLAENIHNKKQIFFIGRGLDSAVAYEASLKLKEISYINSFAIAAGELKHGTIALMEEGTIVIALAGQDRLVEKTLSNIVEVKARDAEVIAVTKEGNHFIEADSDEVIYIPDCNDEVAPILAIIPMQLLAYYVAKAKGEDIDMPRNLAKSVTVE